MMKKCSVLAVLLVAALTPVCAWATIYIQNPSELRHDRFYTGADRDFYLDAFDFSGVGKSISASSKWATMITDTLFLSADHSHPGDSSDTSTVRFHYTNDPNGGYEDRTVIGGTQISGDLWLGQLDAPVSSQVAKYNLLSQADSSALRGEKIFMFGKANNSADPVANTTNQRVGRNVISSSVSTWISFNYNESETTASATYYRSLGVDEAYSVQGDSGGPSFILVNNQPVFVETRTGATGGSNIAGVLDLLQAQVAAYSGGAETVNVVSLPAKRTAPVLVEDFQNDTVGTAPGGAWLTAYAKVRDDGDDRSSTVISDPGYFGDAGNHIVKMVSNDSTATNQLYFEGLPTAVTGGSMKFKTYIESMTGSTAPILRIYVGDDDGSQALDQSETAFRLQFTADGLVQMVTADGTLTADQGYSQNQAMDVEVFFDTLDDPGFSIVINGQTLTAAGGTVDRFGLLSDITLVDAVHLVHIGGGSGATGVLSTLYLDDLLITPVPEPMTLGLLAALLPMAMRRRRRVKQNPRSL